MWSKATDSDELMHRLSSFYHEALQKPISKIINHDNNNNWLCLNTEIIPMKVHQLAEAILEPSPVPPEKTPVQPCSHQCHGEGGGSISNRAIIGEITHICSSGLFMSSCQGRWWGLLCSLFIRATLKEIFKGKKQRSPSCPHVIFGLPKPFGFLITCAITH